LPNIRHQRANFVVANVFALPITNSDIADAIRAMPVNLASLGHEASCTRAMYQLLCQDVARLPLVKPPSIWTRRASPPTIPTARTLDQAWAVTEKSMRALTSLHRRQASSEEIRARVTPCQSPPKRRRDRQDGHRQGRDGFGSMQSSAAACCSSSISAATMFSRRLSSTL
jgi:hypothetical protein